MATRRGPTPANAGGERYSANIFIK
jgi:hypothetical protein